MAGNRKHGLAIALLLTAGGVGAGVTMAQASIAAPLISAAHEDNGRTDLWNIAQIQERALAVSGYAGSVAELEAFRTGDMVATPGDIAGVVMRPGQAYWVAASTDHTHYLAAVQLDTGELLIRSDSHAAAVTCTEDVTSCVAEVTTDPELIAAVPTWTSI